MTSLINLMRFPPIIVRVNYPRPPREIRTPSLPGLRCAVVTGTHVSLKLIEPSFSNHSFFFLPLNVYIIALREERGGGGAGIGFEKLK